MLGDASALTDGLFDEREDSFSSQPVARPSLSSPPPDPQALLAFASGPRVSMYLLVRHCLDDFERVAPWSLLYYPPEEPATLLGMVGSLVEIVQSIPARVDRVLGDFPEEEIPGTHEPTREDVDFLFSGIHGMVKHDLKRLESTVAPFRAKGAAPPKDQESQLLCELCADLKGKYGSAMMGATASLIGEGMWNGVEIEPILFPEKEEEFRGTRELVDNLRQVVAALRQLPQAISFPELLARWKQGLRADQYALADLVRLRGRIGMLLKERNRRALYSGDYQQIRKRESLLTERVNELERLHRQTWSVSASEAAGDLPAIHSRLEQLVQEIAALLDVDILKGMIGEKKVNGLRARVGMAPPRNAKADSMDSLVTLLAEDDLRIFLEMLLGSVLRRACLNVPTPAEREAAAAAAQRPEPLEVEEEEPATLVRMPEPGAPPKKPAAKPAIPVPPPVPASPPVQPDWQSAAWQPEPSPVEHLRPIDSEPPLMAFDVELPPPEPPSDPRVVLARIHQRLIDLQSPANPHWNSFRMIHRLLGKHARIPDAMYKDIHPFLQEIVEHLVPDLRAIVPYGQITVDTVQRLEILCNALRRLDPSPDQMKQEVPLRLERILRFLEALRSVIPAPGASRGALG